MHHNETKFITYWRNSSEFCPLNPEGFGKTDDHVLSDSNWQFFLWFISGMTVDGWQSTEKNASFLICDGMRKSS